MIKRVGSQFCVYSSSGKKLGCHKTKGEAQKQLVAVEVSKKGRRKK